MRQRPAKHDYFCIEESSLIEPFLSPLSSSLSLSFSPPTPPPSLSLSSYLCDDYVLNDNRSGDLALVQSLLSQVASQHYQESYTRSGRVMKPAHSIYRRSESKVEAAIDHAADKRYTALCHWRYCTCVNTACCYIA